MKEVTLFIIAFLAFIFPLKLSAQSLERDVNSGSTKISQNAKVTIEVFNDYECPPCAIFNEKLQIVERKFPDDLQIIIRHFPLVNIHKQAMLEAQAVEAAGMQGKFREMSDLILEKQQKWKSEESPQDSFVDYAKKLRLNIQTFKSDLESQQAKDRIDADVERGKSLNLKGTPTVFLNDKELGFPELDELETLIKKILVNKNRG